MRPLSRSLLWPLDCSTTAGAGGLGMVGGITFYQCMKRSVRCWLMPAERLRRFNQNISVCQPLTHAKTLEILSDGLTGRTKAAEIFFFLSKCWGTTVNPAAIDRRRTYITFGRTSKMSLICICNFCIFAGRNEPRSSKQMLYDDEFQMKHWKSPSSCFPAVNPPVSGKF